MEDEEWSRCQRVVLSSNDTHLISGRPHGPTVMLTHIHARYYVSYGAWYRHMLLVIFQQHIVREAISRVVEYDTTCSCCWFRI